MIFLLSLAEKKIMSKLPFSYLKELKKINTLQVYLNLIENDPAVFESILTLDEPTFSFGCIIQLCL